MHYIFFCKYGLQKPSADEREESICSAASLIILHDMYPAFFDTFNNHVKALSNNAYRAGAALAAKVNYDINILASIIWGDRLYTKTYEHLEECTVKATPELARMCRSHKGNRDPVGINTYIGESNISRIMKILLSNGKNILGAQEEDFVCIPRSQYEEILKIVNDMK